MAKNFYGSINVTKLLEEMKNKHSSFFKSEKGNIYLNVSVWLNDKEDDYGNVLAIKANPKKEKKDVEKGFYIGNCKEGEERQSKPIGDVDIANAAEAVEDLKSDLPF